VSATAAIQTAIYGVLSADATLAGLSLTDETPTVGVFNDVPEGQGYPHVLISKAVETPWHSFGGPTTGLGWKNIIRIHTYSRYQGDKEALGIHGRIVALLNFQPLTVSGYNGSIVEYESLRVFVEDIEKIETRHLVGEFCVMVKQ
jgi:hypothetical protein